MAKRIAVDFDETLFIRKSGSIEIDRPVPGAVAYMNKLKRDGWSIIIYSCRTNSAFRDQLGGQLEYMRKILAEHDMPYDEIDKGRTGKPLATYYLDDKGIGVPLLLGKFVDWPKAYKMITQGTKD